MYDIESHKPGSPEHGAILKSVMEHLRPHNDNEEQRDLPLLTKAIGEEASAEAAASFKRTKKFAPTRFVLSFLLELRCFSHQTCISTHPGAPDKPPFETFAGLMAAPIDKLKDVFAKFPTDEQKQAVKD